LAGRGLLALRRLLARARLRLALAVAARFVAARAATLALAAAALAATLAAAVVAVVAVVAITTAAVAGRAAGAGFALRALAFGGRWTCGGLRAAEKALEPADHAAASGRNRRWCTPRGGLFGCRCGFGARFAHRCRLRGLHVGHRGGRRHVEVGLGQGDGRHLARRAAAVAGLARFLAQFVLAQ